MMMSGQVHTLTSSHPVAVEAPEQVWTFSRRKIFWTCKVMNHLGTTRLRGRPRNRWQHEVREDGRIVGGAGWQEKVHNREERKRLLRTAMNCRILHMPME